jgi:tetratricopeptide (TPR) repeat protein
LALVATGAWLIAVRQRAQVHVVDAQSAALYERGVRAYDRRTPGAIVEAVNTLNAAIARDSLNALAWTALANTYVRAEQRGFSIPGVSHDSLLRRAVNAFDRALALNPNSAEVWLAHALVTSRIDPTDWDSPLRSVQRAIKLDSTMAPAWHVLARARAETGDMDAAIEAWRRCVRVAPGYLQGVAFLALGHYWRREYDSAAVWADSAIALDPNSVLARTTVGQIAIERRDFERAAAAFAAARKLNSDVEVANNFAGAALAAARTGRRTEARAAMHQADSVAALYLPTPLHAATFLAQAHAALGEIDQAIAWLRKYDTPRDLHFQMHLRCDPPFDVIAGDPRFRSLLLPIASKSERGCARSPAIGEP